MVFEGLSVALVTPFTECTDYIDFNSLHKLIERQVGLTDYFILFGSTGEGLTLTKEEKMSIVYDCLKKFPNEKFIVNVGGSNTREVLTFVNDLNSLPVYAYMATVPAYNKPNDEGLYNHFKKVNDKSAKPILLYNIPSRTCINMKSSIVQKLVKNCKNIMGIKESSGQFNQMIELLKIGGLEVLAGDDYWTSTVISHGGVGVVSVLGNIEPQLMKELVLDSKNNLTKAVKLQLSIYDKVNSLFIDSNPVPTKFILKSMGVIENESVREPLTPLSREFKIDKPESNKFVKISETWGFKWRNTH